MAKATYRSAIITAIFGLLLFIPFGSIKGLIYDEILIIHIFLGIILGIMIIILFYKHVKVEIGNPFKRGVKKWNGFKTLLYLIVAILSGVIVLFFQIGWLIYFHGLIGLWALLVGWKHKK